MVFDKMILDKTSDPLKSYDEITFFYPTATFIICVTDNKYLSKSSFAVNQLYSDICLPNILFNWGYIDRETTIMQLP
jgi:hypothetical protein